MRLQTNKISSKFILLLDLCITHQLSTLGLVNRCSLFTHQIHLCRSVMQTEPPCDFHLWTGDWEVDCKNPNF